MAIREYFDENGKKLYSVNVVVKSRKDPYIRFRRNKKGFTSKHDAQRVEDRLRSDGHRYVVDRESESIKWGKLVEEWEQAVKQKDIFAKHISNSTLLDYSTYLRIYTKKWFEIPTDQLTPSEVWSTLHELEHSKSIASRKKLRAGIDSVFDWAIRSKKLKGVEGKPTTGYKGLTKKVEKAPEILTFAEIKKLLESAKQLNHEWYDVWAFALMTGMRSGELFALRWDRVNLEAKTILVDTSWSKKNGFGPTKGKWWRVIPINSELRRLLLKQRASTGSSEFVLPRIRAWENGRGAEILRGFLKSIGVTPVRFHALRACFATQILSTGVAAATVMRIGGWKDFGNMQIYLRMAGIDVEGATDDLKLLPEDDAMEKIVPIFKSND